MYPGVPLVSEEFSGFHILAIPKSVIRKYPARFKSRIVRISDNTIIKMGLRTINKQ